MEELCTTWDVQNHMNNINWCRFWTSNSILRGVSCWDATLKYDMNALFRFNPELLWVLQCRFCLNKQQLSHHYIGAYRLTTYVFFLDCLSTYLRPPHIKRLFAQYKCHDIFQAGGLWFINRPLLSASCNLSRNGKFSIAAIQRRFGKWRFVKCAVMKTLVSSVM